MLNALSLTSFFAPLRHYNLRQLCINAILHGFGVGGERLVLGLLVFQVTDSSAGVGMVLALYFAPMLFVGGLAGALADWVERRRLLQIFEATIGVNLCVFGFLVAWGEAALWQILGMALLAGSLRALVQPVRSSYAYDIVGAETVVSGLSFLNIATQIGQILGALLAGSVMQRLGAEVAFFILSLVHGVAALLLFKLRPMASSEKIQQAVSLWQNLREYLAEMRHNRSLLMLLFVTASVEVFGFSFMTALPEIATKRLGVGAEGLGWLHGAQAFGGFVAGLILAHWGKRGGWGILYLYVILGFGLSLLSLAFAPALTLALLAVGWVSGMAISSDILTQSMMQRSVPNHLRGRAMGIWTLAVGFAPLGHLQMGFLISKWGTDVALTLNALALTLVGVLTFLWVPQIRKL